MRRVRVLLGVVLMSGVCLAGLWGQDAKTVPVRASLPANWKKLGLTDQQRAKVLQVRAEYAAKVAELQTRIGKVREEEKAELAKILTPAQKDRLREILASKAGDADSGGGTAAKPAKDAGKQK